MKTMSNEYQVYCIAIFADSSSRFKNDASKLQNDLIILACDIKISSTFCFQSVCCDLGKRLENDFHLACLTSEIFLWELTLSNTLNHFLTFRNPIRIRTADLLARFSLTRCVSNYMHLLNYTHSERY